MLFLMSGGVWSLGGSFPVEGSLFLSFPFATNLMSDSRFLALQRAMTAFKARLATGFGWSLLSTFALQGSVLLTGLLLARVLGLRQFGIYAVATTTVMAMVGVVQGGVGLMGTKFVGEWLHAEKHRIGRLLHMCAVFTLVTGLSASVLLWFASPWVADALLQEPLVESSLKWAAVSVVFHVQTLYLQGALQGFGAFRAISTAGTQIGLLHIVSSAAGAWWFGLDGAVIAFTVSSVTRWWVFRQALRKACKDHEVSISKEPLPEDWALIWKFALPAGLASLVTLPCMWGVTALVARQPSGVELVGLFSVSHQLRQLVLQIPAVLNTVVSSVLSRLKGQNNAIEYWQVFRLNILVGGAFSAVVAMSMALLSGPVLSLYGQGFLAAQSLLLVLMLSVVPEVVGSTAYQLVQSSGRMWSSLFYIISPRDLSYFALAVWALPVWGLSGAGAAYVAAHAIGCAMTFVVGLRGYEHLPNRSR
jgi:O-antigen/teichoic acid export membrane protein